jgi:ketosteroid isomerase-like protein
MEMQAERRRPSSKTVVDEASIAAEAQVRERLLSWVNSIRSRDTARVLAHYAPDVPTFNVTTPLSYASSAATAKAWQEWSSSFDGPIGYEVRELTITAGNDVAFAHSLNRVTGTRKDGKKVAMWLRATIGLRKIEGLWMFAHEHYSVPVDMATGRAAFDAAP